MHRLRPPLKGFGQRGPSGKIQRTAIRKIQRKRRRRRRLRLWRATGLVVPIVGNAKKTKGVEERQAEERQTGTQPTKIFSPLLAYVLHTNNDHRDFPSKSLTIVLNVHKFLQYVRTYFA